MNHRILNYTAPFKKPEVMNKIKQVLSGPQYQQIPIKTPSEIQQLKIAGGICANILDEISPFVKPG